MRRAPTTAPPGGAPRGHLLVVEDDPALRALVVEVLAAEGYRAHGAADKPPVRIARTSFEPTPAWSASSRRIRLSSPAARAWYPNTVPDCIALTVSRPIARSGARSES